MPSLFRPAYTLGKVLLALSLGLVFAAWLLGLSGVLDRGVIAFARYCPYRMPELYQLDIAHQIGYLLTSRHIEIHNLSFSPNGRWLAVDASDSDELLYYWRSVSVIDLSSYEEFPLAPGYMMFNGTPLIWHSDEQLELWMLSLPNNTATQQLGLQSVIVNVAQREVRHALPLSEAAQAVRSTNIFADSDVSSEGHRIYSRSRGGFDLYVQYEGTDEEVRITHDDCIERYPRWRPN